MEVYEKLLKQIDETRYLNAENSWRYRPIMRIFYQHYEKLEYWLYKEDIFNELKENEIFQNYTMEECERDLENLTDWRSLTRMQDTNNAQSIEEFKNKKYRYQLTEYATEIERLVIHLENLEIKTASLEPKLFDRLRALIHRLEKINDLSEEEANEIWNDLDTNFKQLNENYQDFLKKFNEPKSEDLLQSVLFLKFKGEIIRYLKEFIKGYQNNIYYITSSINKITDDDKEIFVNKLVSYNKKNPMLNDKFDFSKLKILNLGKINSIFKWFVGNESEISEGAKLMRTTENIIVLITKYANSLIELHGNMTSRREEYKKIATLFDKITDINEAHKLASLILGVSNVRHIVGNSNINTDSIINSLDVPAIEVALASRTRTIKEKVKILPIVDKSHEKKRLLEEYRYQQEENKNILRKLIKDKKIVLDNTITLSKLERRYIQKLLTSGLKKETEFGLSYNIQKKNGKCIIKSEDGIFMMDSLEIDFEGEL